MRWLFRTVSSDAVVAPEPKPTFDLSDGVQAFVASGYRLGLTSGGALALRNASQWTTPSRLCLDKWLWNFMCARGQSSEFGPDVCARFELALRCSATETPRIVK